MIQHLIFYKPVVPSGLLGNVQWCSAGATTWDSRTKSEATINSPLLIPEWNPHLASNATRRFRPSILRRRPVVTHNRVIQIIFFHSTLPLLKTLLLLLAAVILRILVVMTKPRSTFIAQRLLPGNGSPFSAILWLALDPSKILPVLLASRRVTGEQISIKKWSDSHAISRCRVTVKLRWTGGVN